MKLDYRDYLNSKIVSELSKNIESFELHKIENETILFWQPKQGIIEEFENSGTSFETYLETLFDSHKIDFGHGYLDPNLDFKEGIEDHYHLTPEEIKRVNNMENEAGMFYFQGDAYVCRYDVFDVILSDKREEEIMKKAVELLRQKKANNEKLTYAEKEVLRIRDSIDELDALMIAMEEQEKNPVFISKEEYEKLYNTPHISIDLNNHRLGTLDGVKDINPKK